MRRFCKRSLAVLLAVLILFGTCEAGVAYAVDEIDKAINPAEQIELTVPEAFADGENWFFIANADWSAGEKSGEKLYIPIQRAGDLNSEAVVTLKVIDLSAKHDVNYTVEVYKEKVTPETAIADLSMVELAQNADGQEEVQLGSENDMGQVLYEVGGADIVDGEGSVVGSISATPMDENGNPIPEPETETAADEPEAETAADEPETETAADDGESSDEASEWTEAELSGPAALLAARNAATGTISDRQPLAAPDMTEQTLMAGDEFGKDMAAATEDGYPGREYTLRFKAGEDAKFLVITPLYSEAAEGDAQILLMLKNPGEGWAIGENVNPVSVTILDEDEPILQTLRPHQHHQGRAAQLLGRQRHGGRRVQRRGRQALFPRGYHQPHCGDPSVPRYGAEGLLRHHHGAGGRGDRYGHHPCPDPQGHRRRRADEHFRCQRPSLYRSHQPQGRVV